jgi:signal transduction histidine kinase
MAMAAVITVQVDQEDDDEPVAAAVDVQLFERAVANLVDNALKFCGPGCRVTLAAEASPAGPRVTGTDDGPGIPEADLTHLFDRVCQARQRVAPATGEGGKGLGLAIVKRIVELHQGTVAVHSPPGQGTGVLIQLPGQGREGQGSRALATFTGPR